MFIDELLTPDSSRYWLAETYGERFRKGLTPDTFDKDILRRRLAEQGFTGEGPVPLVDAAVIKAMSEAYAVPYKMLTGKTLPTEHDPAAISKEISRQIKPFVPTQPNRFKSTLAKIIHSLTFLRK